MDGTNKKNLDKANTNSKEVKISTISAGTTGQIQPHDVYGFRPWKNFIKYFSDSVILFDYDVNLHSRNNILELQSLTHNRSSHRQDLLISLNMLGFKWLY